ncbi:hypothetical protein CANCADRAFT_3015 [Tortispora caseinolytica NRRL Y-17796]|uniref:G-patch domain-containing protein n=1 Tax=Tortispora caseinolytica NRRL Y-17796 TaxID=767744 RepID=A0A1E4THS0_9ASCO|nr:hypothetical protein CANCADRAFT_3015 [Tortispora caseinolytica NRRL Y-17796]
MSDADYTYLEDFEDDLEPSPSDVVEEYMVMPLPDEPAPEFPVKKINDSSAGGRSASVSKKKLEKALDEQLKLSRGSRIMQNMGYIEGKSLGKNQKPGSLISPVSVEMKTGRSGIGAPKEP